MTYYLIDYENTNSKGLKGCRKLKKCDRVYIFFSENASKINLDFFTSRNKAKVSSIKVPVKKQSLDMHISSYVGYLIGKNRKDEECRFVIISKDNDYDNIVEFWKKQKVKIERRETISDKAIANEYDKPEYSILEVELFKILDNQEETEMVIEIIEKCTSKLAINNSLMNRFKDSKKSGEIYNIIKPYINDKT